jgi:hypothetical protein
VIDEWPEVGRTVVALTGRRLATSVGVTPGRTADRPLPGNRDTYTFGLIAVEVSLPEPPYTPITRSFSAMQPTACCGPGGTEPQPRRLTQQRTHWLGGVAQPGRTDWQEYVDVMMQGRRYCLSRGPVAISKPVAATVAAAVARLPKQRARHMPTGQQPCAGALSAVRTPFSCGPEYVMRACGPAAPGRVLTVGRCGAMGRSRRAASAANRSSEDVLSNGACQP